jgi:Ca2+-binding RTX toxin-like protein
MHKTLHFAEPRTGFRLVWAVSSTAIETNDLEERKMAIVNGTAGDDLLNGTSGSDSIYGSGGNDTISGLEGNDIIFGGDGDDNLFGGEGNDSLYSDAGAGLIWGGAGSDSIYGNGSWNVWARYDYDQGPINANMRMGIVTDGSGGIDRLYEIYSVAGSAYNDTLDAKGTSSTIGFFGGAGDDALTGGWAGDVLFGSEGNDKIDGGDGISGTREGAWGSAYRLYRATLGREPDVSGFENWSYALSHGVSLEAAASQFLTSTEFRSVYGALDNAQFVTLLYQNVLGRTPDAGGLSEWVRALNAGATRASVVAGFSDSTEFKNNTSIDVDAFATSKVSNEHQGQIYRLYRATLGREPDSGGFLDWMNALDTGGQSLKTVVAGFVGSTEFQATYGSLNNTQFVTLMYTNVLGRAPDATGLSNWVHALNNGMSRTDVVVGFSDSTEFRSTTSGGFKSYMASSFGSWNDWIEGGAGNDVLIGGRGADDFSFLATDAGGSNDVYGLENVDRLWFDGYGYSNASDALSHMSQNGKNVVFSDASQSITFHNVTLAQVAQSNIFVTSAT